MISWHSLSSFSPNVQQRPGLYALFMFPGHINRPCTVFLAHKQYVVKGCIFNLLLPIKYSYIWHTTMLRIIAESGLWIVFIREMFLNVISLYKWCCQTNADYLEPLVPLFPCTHPYALKAHYFIYLVGSNGTIARHVAYYFTSTWHVFDGP